MMAAEVVAGMKEFEKWLKQFEPKLVKKAIRTATREGAKIVAADAQTRVPIRTGVLRASFKVRATKRSRSSSGHRVLMGSEKGQKAKGLPYYASFVELGHKARDKTTQVPAQPFLRPALWSNQERVKALYRHIVGDFLKKETNQFGPKK